jgi:hypothetical protein
MDSLEHILIPFMPDGRPCPAVLTSEEAAAFLRLDGTGQRALKFWRDQGELVGIRVGRKIRYPLSEVMRFLTQKIEKSKSNGAFVSA